MTRCRGLYCIAKPVEGSKYCPKCQAKAEAKFKAYSTLYETGRRERDERERKFYNSAEWKAFRLTILEARTTCEECRKAFSFAVHHIVPLKVDWERRLDPTNMRALCSSCHSKHELTERNKARVTSK